MIERVRLTGIIPEKSIESLKACIRLLRTSTDLEFKKPEGAQGRQYNINRRKLSELCSPDRMWCLAGLICDELYKTVGLMRVLCPDKEDVRRRDSLVHALTVLIGVIYTDAYDIAPFSSWGPNQLINLVPLTPDAMGRKNLGNYARLNLFRQFFHNGVSPSIATELVRNWYLLQPRNRTEIHEKGIQIDRELNVTAKAAREGTGKFWTAWQYEPYAAWDVHHGRYMQSNHFTEWPLSGGWMELSE